MTLIAFYVALSAMSQTPYKVYAELLGFQKGLFSKKVKVNVDFGQEVSFWKQGNMRLVSEDGKDIVFNSMIDAMNFMGKNGWAFEQAYVVTESGQNVYHWLLSKMVTDENQIKEGFNVKADFTDVSESFRITYFRKAKHESVWTEVKTEVIKPETPDEVNEIMNNWKSQESDKYDYDCKVAKN